MAKRIKITEQQLNNIKSKVLKEDSIIEEELSDMILESVYTVLAEAHLAEVNNINTAIKLIDAQWKSEDDAWWVKIEARLKDYKNYNKRNPGQKPRWWKRTPGPDGTGRENHVGYVLVSGKTKEECIDSIKNAVVHLNPWAAQIAGTDTVYSNGNMEAIKQICKMFLARAYMTLNKRSLSDVNARVAIDKQSGLFKGREFHHRMGQPRTGIDKSGRDWTKERPFGLTDCDVDNAQGQKELEDYFTKMGISPFAKDQSHDGMHYYLNNQDGSANNLDFKFMQKYSTNNRKGDPAVLYKPDANMILYSAVG